MEKQSTLKGWICGFYDRNMYWLCIKRVRFVVIAFLLAIAVSTVGLQFSLLPQIGEQVSRLARLTRDVFFLLAFCWIVDFRFYGLTIKSKDVYHRQPDSYKVFSFFRLLACIVILAFGLFLSWRLFRLLTSTGLTPGELVSLFFTVN